MERTQVTQITQEKDRLRYIAGEIWDKYGWSSSSDVDKEILNRELKTRISPSSIPYIYYHILGGENYDSFNQGLKEIEAFTGDPESAHEDYYDYLGERQKRTWAQVVEEEIPFTPTTEKITFAQKLKNFLTKRK